VPCFNFWFWFCFVSTGDWTQGLMTFCEVVANTVQNCPTCWSKKKYCIREGSLEKQMYLCVCLYVLCVLQYI
jgi:hypothetical protein